LIASPENFGWRRRSATNWRRKSDRWDHMEMEGD
jgi:hypothetical protein